MKTFFTIEDRVVPASHPRMLVHVAVAQGADRDALLAAAGVTYEALLDPDHRLSYAEYFRIADAAIRITGNPAIGLDFGAQARLAHWGVVGLAAMNGVTGGQALRVGLQYYRTYAPGWDLSVHVEDGVGHFVARETVPRGKLLPFGTEAMLMTFQKLTTELVGRALPVRELSFGYPRPAHAERYRDYFVADVLSFDHAVTEALFDPKTMDVVIDGADPSAGAIAERYCAAEAARVNPTVGLLAEVRKVLVRGLAPRPTLEDVARELRTSSRSLRRGLQEMGTSFRTLLDEAAKVRAEELVRRHSDKLEHVATELGFSDVRTFRRAFKRWTGHSPAAFRNRAAR
ncbi:MAG TPA: AraC family transcriptional regulator [Polyangiaceae bacterium]|jgi:AraC-like DNA-binding protein|nr:AraC family transcriptional regulator [Polyangiaceae bacterium]